MATPLTPARTVPLAASGAGLLLALSLVLVGALQLALHSDGEEIWSVLTNSGMNAFENATVSDSIGAVRSAVRKAAIPRQVAVYSIYAGAYILKQALLLPASPLFNFAAGQLFGLAEGLAIVMLSNAIGAWVCFGLALEFEERLFPPHKRADSKLGSLLKMLENQISGLDTFDLSLFCIALRMVPGMPHSLLTVAMALSGVRFVPFALGTVLGMIPYNYISVQAGDAFGRHVAGEELSPQSFTGTAVVLVMIGAAAAWHRRRGATALAPSHSASRAPSRTKSPQTRRPSSRRSSPKSQRSTVSAATPPKKTEPAADDSTFEVERIIEWRVAPRTRAPEYLVKWKGYGLEEATWEPKQNLAGCPALLAKFEKEKFSSPGRRTASPRSAAKSPTSRKRKAEGQS